MGTYRYCNPNPLKKEVGDCVVRAFSVATDMSWDDVYNELCRIGFQLKAMPNDKETYQAFLLNHGYKYHGISNKKGSKRPTVKDMKKMGSVICVVANHLVTIKDKEIYDLWDSSEKSLYGYWIKEQE